ncbi:unnamed protein product [Rotaria sp. Silwood1]|nr:unnamed protein product [Rotaria sp. Silwood1]
MADLSIWNRWLSPVEIRTISEQKRPVDQIQGFPYYFYERTFDLICALNIIMAMSNADMKRSIDSFKNLQDVNKVALKSLEL